MEYYFDLAGLCTVLRTPGNIEIAPRLRPFLLEPQAEPDCTVQVRPVPTLPEMSPNGIWHGLEYYDRRESLRIFHCIADSRETFAVTEFAENGSVEILVRPEYLSWFSGTSGIFNRIGMENLLLQHNALLLHASLIDHDGNGIAFAGPSGAGKSTQAALWEQYAGADILNGDRAVIRQTEKGVFAYGSPYAGTSGIYRRASVPLRAVVVLRKGKENILRKLCASEAMMRIYPELSIHRWDKEFSRQASDLLLTLLRKVPFYELECLPERSAVQHLKEGLDL